MEESAAFSIPPEECGDSELDPRIQLELEKLNTATAEINKLELELDESNTTFRMLLNEATRRLKGLAGRLGNSVEKARPYHEAAEAAAKARTACQRAAVQYQRASEIHAAAKETVALAEQRFKSKQHEWQFDNAWQEMLNHATIKVMDAETQKAESGREHQKRAQLFNAAETKVQHLEDQLRKHIIKSRAYFEEKQLCGEQLSTQKGRIEQLQKEVHEAKLRYSRSLRTLEAISEDIHRKRRALYGDSEECPVGPREPGVGAEKDASNDYSLELERHDLDVRRSECGSPESCAEESSGLEELRRRVRKLAARPLEGGGSHGDSSWEEELNTTVQKLDQMLLARERRALQSSQSAYSSFDKPFHHFTGSITSSDSAPHSLSQYPEASAVQESRSKSQESSSVCSFEKSSEDVPHLEYSEDTQSHTASHHSHELPDLNKNITRTQLCLSVTNLQDLLPLESPYHFTVQNKSVYPENFTCENDSPVREPFAYKSEFDSSVPVAGTSKDKFVSNFNSETELDPTANVYETKLESTSEKSSPVKTKINEHNAPHVSTSYDNILQNVVFETCSVNPKNQNRELAKNEENLDS